MTPYLQLKNNSHRTLRCSWKTGKDVNELWWNCSTPEIKGKKLEKINDTKRTISEQRGKGPGNRSHWVEQKPCVEEECDGRHQQTISSWMVFELTDRSYVLSGGKRKAAERTHNVVRIERLSSPLTHCTIYHGRGKREQTAAVQQRPFLDRWRGIR